MSQDHIDQRYTKDYCWKHKGTEAIPRKDWRLAEHLCQECADRSARTRQAMEVFAQSMRERRPEIVRHVYEITGDIPEDVEWGEIAKDLRDSLLQGLDSGEL